MRDSRTLKRGKAVAHRTYYHVDFLDADQRPHIEKAADFVGLKKNDDYNVVRIDNEGSISFLDYQDFFTTACPKLARSWLFHPATKQTVPRDYRRSVNPPILHRKELLIGASHPQFETFSRLTKALEQIGVFDDSRRIGHLLQWNDALKAAGYEIVDHELVPIANEIASDSPPDPGDSTVVARHLTALKRTSMSAPIVALLREGLISGEASVFDFGCGHGKDVECLRAKGFAVSGWDPHFLPDGALVDADVVNLGFVLNVIENEEERHETLKRAHGLARKILCVSVMLARDGVQGTPFSDGILTTRGTFQKYFTQDEIREYLITQLDREPIALAPGVFVVFTDTTAETDFWSRNQTKQSRRKGEKSRYRGSTSVSSPLDSEKIRENVKGIASCWERLGRMPTPDEIDVDVGISNIPRLVRMAGQIIDMATVAEARKRFIDDIVVKAALAEVLRKPIKLSDFSIRDQKSIRLFFGDFSKAKQIAKGQLVACGNADTIDTACREAAANGLGWYWQDGQDACLQVHGSLIDSLPQALRVLISCAILVLDGSELFFDLVKIDTKTHKVSFFKFNSFDAAIPQLQKRYTIFLRTQGIQFQEIGREGPVFLCSKSRYMSPKMKGFPQQEAFDKRLAEFLHIDDDGKVSAKHLINTLKNYNLKVEGLRLVDGDNFPGPDDPCGRFLKYRDLIECGETVKSTGLSNIPRSPESYRSLRLLAENILDPVIDWYGSIRLTYGFCSHPLSNLIKSRVAPRLDQHCCAEKNRRGRLICERQGAAADFFVDDEDMYEVLKWVANNTPFDRMYFYGSDRPLHVSFGPEHKREIIHVVTCENGKRLPRPMKI